MCSLNSVDFCLASGVHFRVENMNTESVRTSSFLLYPCRFRSKYGNDRAVDAEDSLSNVDGKNEVDARRLIRARTIEYRGRRVERSRVVVRGRRIHTPAVSVMWVLVSSVLVRTVLVRAVLVIPWAPIVTSTERRCDGYTSNH